MNPAALQGEWRRNWLRTAEGEDATTRVHWVQSGQWCADIRVPLIRPGVQAGALARLTGPELAQLLAAEGFAGHITLEGDICTWTRSLNWRGFPCATDAGRLWFDPAGFLIEDGVFADYREEWAHVPGPKWQPLALATDTAEGLLLTTGTRFLLGLGQQQSAAWPTLAAALAGGTAQPADAAPAFESVYVLGHWSAAGQGIADLSTQPFAEGHPVLTLGADTAQLTLPDFDGRVTTRSLRLTPLDPH